MFRWRHSKSELRASVRKRRRWKARSRRAARSKRALLATIDPATENPGRPPSVDRTGPVGPPTHGKRGRRYEVIDLGGGVFGLRVDRRIVSHHATAAEANRCIELMEENR